MELEGLFQMIGNYGYPMVLSIVVVLGGYKILGKFQEALNKFAEELRVINDRLSKIEDSLEDIEKK